MTYERVVGFALDREHHRAARRLDGLPHSAVDFIVRVCSAIRIGTDTARIVLDVVNTPRCPLRRILHLVVARGREARARVWALGRVQSRLEPECVDLVGDGLEAVRAVGWRGGRGSWGARPGRAALALIHAQLLRVCDLLALRAAGCQHPAVLRRREIERVSRLFELGKCGTEELTSLLTYSYPAAARPLSRIACAVAFKTSAETEQWYKFQVCGGSGGVGGCVSARARVSANFGCAEPACRNQLAGQNQPAKSSLLGIEARTEFGGVWYARRERRRKKNAR